MRQAAHLLVADAGLPVLIVVDDGQANLQQHAARVSRLLLVVLWRVLWQKAITACTLPEG